MKMANNNDPLLFVTQRDIRISDRIRMDTENRLAVNMIDRIIVKRQKTSMILMLKYFVLKKTLWAIMQGKIVMTLMILVGILIERSLSDKV